MWNRFHSCTYQLLAKIRCRHAWWEKEKFDNCEQHCERYKFVLSKIRITNSTSTSTSMVPVNSIVWRRFERLLGPAELTLRSQSKEMPAQSIICLAKKGCEFLGTESSQRRDWEKRLKASCVRLKEQNWKGKEDKSVSNYNVFMDQGVNLSVLQTCGNVILWKCFSKRSREEVLEKEEVVQLNQRPSSPYSVCPAPYMI